MDSLAPLSDNEYVQMLLDDSSEPSTPAAGSAEPPTAAAAADPATAAAIAAKVIAAKATAAEARAEATAAAAIATAAVATTAADAADAAEPDRMDGIEEYGPQGQGVSLYSDDEEDRRQQETMEHFAPIPNPSENQEFESHAAAEKELKSFSLRHGFEVSKYGNAVKGPAGNIIRRPYRCSKGLSKSNLIRYRAQKDAQGLPEERKKPSKKTGCPFSATIHAIEKSNPESRYTIVLGVNPIHNHPAVNPIGLASHRRANRTQLRQFLRNARDSQIEPRKICPMAQREFAERHGEEMVPPVLRDIYNEWAAIRSETLQGATPVERTMEMLRRDHFFHSTRVDATSRLEGLFFAHPRLITIYKANCDVLIMDCTYKTNKYGLPLLCFVAITRVGIAIPVAHTLLHGEDEAAFTWALNCFKDMLNQHSIDEPSVVLHDRDRALMRGLEAVFPGIPHLLCQWHMNEDVKANANATFGMERLPEGRWVMSPQGEAFLAMYQSCINAKTVEAFDTASDELKAKHPEDPKWQKMARYLDVQWWPHKQLCVTAWTDNIRHYNTSTTSIVEGAHANLKGWLQSSRNDLLRFFEKLQGFYDGHVNRYGQNLAKAQSAGVTPFTNLLSRFRS